jgi:hypothetical protein
MSRFENVKNEEALEKLFTSRGFNIPEYRARENDIN